MGKYQIIYCDPPWSHDDKGNAGERGASYKYNTMDMGQLMAMRSYIDTLAAKDCLLAMWWVGPMPQEAIDLVRAWGFTLKTFNGFTWHKKTKNGKDAFGGGSYTRCNAESCLFAIRGKRWRASASVPQIIESEIREHSRKPDEARDRLVTLLGDVPRIELFARQRHAGWDAHGDELSPISIYDYAHREPASPEEMFDALQAWQAHEDASKRCDEGGNDGADVFEATEALALARALTKKILGIEKANGTAVSVKQGPMSAAEDAEWITPSASAGFIARSDGSAEIVCGPCSEAGGRAAYHLPPACANEHDMVLRDAMERGRMPDPDELRAALISEFNMEMPDGLED